MKKDNDDGKINHNVINDVGEDVIDDDRVQCGGCGRKFN